ncbi:phosphonate ABC transporter [Halalkalibacter wakoensis JCM 9140]|uniref:Phosphonate ABC transporter n=1 Tax=Halalkalibacter wakoensis JCM 9140 TaxID=1236970 RepID=W4Q3C4_9BACI|nr:hypothetical protein [Halalkalibacter wakoensis]GAE26430.1 phosphonate ABC transporter [Halalkalibacter wakoensis JCM 9140]
MKKFQDSKDKMTKRIILFLAIVLFVYSIFQLEIMPDRILKSWERSQHLLFGMIPPTLDEPIDIAGAALESLQVAVMGTLFGVIFSVILACFAARNLAPHWTISYAVKGFAAFVRAVPALIWAILFIIAVGLGPTPGILAWQLIVLGCL